LAKNPMSQIWTLVRRPDVILAGAVLVFGLLAAGLGLGSVPRTWVLAGTAVFTIAGLTYGHALTPQVRDRSRRRALHATVILLVIFIVGSAGYANWWDPSKAPPAVGEYILMTDDPTQCLAAHGYPGGPKMPGDPGLSGICGGQAHRFTCRAVLKDGEIWLRIEFNRYWWFPESALRPAAGVSQTVLPTCKN